MWRSTPQPSQARLAGDSDGTTQFVIFLDRAQRQTHRHRATPAGELPPARNTPYDYFADVLQRVGQHPASRAHELTPRLWKQLFAHNSLRSDLHQTILRDNHAAG